MVGCSAEHGFEVSHRVAYFKYDVFFLTFWVRQLFFIRGDYDDHDVDKIYIQYELAVASEGMRA